MSEPFLGEVRAVGFKFAPRGWQFCNGQLLAISQNQALFSLLGTTYGGDGRTTFALPNLQGRVPIHPGPSIDLGRSGGQESHTLTTSEIPAHTHALSATSTAGGADPLSRGLASAKAYAPGTSTPAAMDASSIANAGQSLAHPNVQPSLVVNYIIAVEGLFPSRS